MTVVSGQPRANSSSTYSSLSLRTHFILSSSRYILPWYSFNFIRSRDSSTKVYITYKRERGGEQLLQWNGMKNSQMEKKIKTLSFASLCNSMVFFLLLHRPGVCVCVFELSTKVELLFLHGALMLLLLFSCKMYRSGHRWNIIIPFLSLSLSLDIIHIFCFPWYLFPPPSTSIPS